MTLDELKSLYTEAVKLLRTERAMRGYVFRSDPLKREEKLAEIDRLMAIVAQLKGAAKAGCDPGYEQPRLLDAPRKAGYE